MATEMLGWAMGIDRWRDETRTFHLIIDRGDNVARPACGTPLYTGGIERDTDRGHRCRSCQRIEDRLKGDHP